MTSHIFTQSGLGNAPFKIVAYTEKNTGCAFCGRAIKKVCVIVSADGVKSNIGCDCIKKVGDAGLISASKVAVKQYNAKVKYEALQDKYYDSMFAVWGNHANVDQSLIADKAAFLKEMERVMYEEANA